ncbi:WcaI family glycosyltransferase [Chitinophaga pinensis]|uniref:Glycosyl transferase group 1 n=1 Tax=Chitinophaga pinensis (strain ATCC 43595 / DSM 2588 / LMG 13176 / NBRC 15968 / NCIMB 11800 / UQM 2034) TaxID=485918 RepID=A0A979G330_CHIPD|nr:WcaI family glycosyltransferase [Chitinophaga pinensis]ACU59768.1 glycosyl transferase group 1 [Chitinophaga pinensis DSM 2588]
MSKRLLLIGGNFAPELTGVGKYNGEMIGWLANNGYDCTVITSFPHYPQWKIQAPYTKSRYWYKKETGYYGHVKVYRCPQYIPARPSGGRRLLMDFSFALSASFQLLLELFRKKADFVMVVAPPFHLGLLGVLYSKLRKATFIYHVQDLQIEAARDLHMISSPALIKLLFGIERFILGRADIISSISEGMIQKIREKCGHTITSFPNWVDVRLFHPLEHKQEIKTAYGFASSDTVILYAGAIGEKQGLEAILHVAQQVRHQSHIKFLICGAGPYREKLHQQVHAQGLRNIQFRDPEPFDNFNRLLNMADVHLVIQKASAGDLVMPSKLTTILAVGGVAVVTANEHTSLYKVVTENEIGIVVPADDAGALASGILQAVTKSQEHITGNARRYALEYLSIDKIMSRMEDTIRAST